MKYLLIFFLGIVSVGMVVTLAPLPTGDTSANPNSNVLATLGDYQVTTQDLQKQLSTRFQQSPLGNNPQLMAQFAPNILDAMVQDQAVGQEAKRLGLEVSDPELMQAIHSYPGLTQNGKFVGMQEYQAMIEQGMNMTVPQFEAQLRQGLLSDKLRDVVTDAIQVTPAEVHQEFIQRNEKAKIQYVLFNPPDFTKDVQVTPSQLQAYFATSKERYKQPEQRSLRYVLIDADHVRSMVKISDDRLRSYYTQHLNDYKVPDEVKMSQILFKTSGKTPEEVAKIRQTAQDALSQIQKGGDFAELAKKYSEDTTSAPKGGDVGWIQHGQTVQEVENVAFSLQPGQVSGLITTTYGIVIIKVFDKQTAHVQSFDSVKAGIESTLQKQAITAAQAQLADQFSRAAKADPAHFGAVAAKLGLAVQNTGLFRPNAPIPDLGISEGLQTLAFQLQPNQVGDPLTLAKGVVVVQLDQDIPAHVPTLDEVRPQVEQDYRADQSKVIAGEKARDFAGKVKIGGDFKKLAQTMGLTVKESKDFARQETVDNLISGTELADAFTLNPGQTSGVVTAGANKLVFQVVSHTPADESLFAAQKAQIQQQLLDQKKSFAWELYRQALKQRLIKEGKLKINQEAMKALQNSYLNQPS
ncbi:MAG TPA: peptidyl-prolyl cis-trans isomerase [Terriglobia bacterium]|nr:peptidyl-prolyl cis-trans isomerase [Terriglobia bacterium]